MIRPPINPLTPPVRLVRPDRTKPTSASKPQTGTGGGSGSGGGSTQTPAPDIPSLESLFEQMLAHYVPETIEFTPLSEDILRDTIANWLRPAYEQAIADRRDRTQHYNAELDADAWSRGMGSSTYLSDVKERQYRGEARDVDALESDYASTLAGHLYDAMERQQEAKLEVDRFNAEQINHAREQAMSAAQALYRAYQSAASSSHGTGGSGGHAASPEAQPTETPSIVETLLAGQANRPTTDYNSVANVLARMSPLERSKLYDRSDPTYFDFRSEILYSLGQDAFAALMRAFPGA